MSNKSGAIGRQTENAVVRVLRANGWPTAERRRLTGAFDKGDVNTGDPRLVIEVKGGNAARGASDGQVTKWLEETEVERVNAAADIGVLVYARKGIGYANAENWWMVMTMRTFMRLIGVNTQVMSADLWNKPIRLKYIDGLGVLYAAGYGTH